MNLARNLAYNFVRIVRRKPWHILMAVIVILISIFSSNSPDAKLHNAVISGLKTYRLVNATTHERVAQSTFQTGDSIQVGFDYTKLAKAESPDSLVQFVVIKEKSDKPLFTTTMFQLEPDHKSLFVSINNTNLPAGAYTVQLRNAKARTVTQLNYVIKAR